MGRCSDHRMVAIWRPGGKLGWPAIIARAESRCPAAQGGGALLLQILKKWPRPFAHADGCKGPGGGERHLRQTPQTADPGSGSGPSAVSHGPGRCARADWITESPTVFCWAWPGDPARWAVEPARAEALPLNGPGPAASSCP